MLGKSISRNSLILAAFALITAGLLAITHSATKNLIADQKKLAAERALLEIVARERHDNSMLDTIYNIPADMLAELGLNEKANIHIATQNGEAVAIIIPSTAADGYSGDINMLVGINTDGTISGVRVISHRETPGLGDKVDLNKSSWILDFDGLSLNAPPAESWRVKKDGGHFDQFTGATITPRAVVQQVRKTLELYAANKETILDAYLDEEPSHE